MPLTHDIGVRIPYPLLKRTTSVVRFFCAVLQRGRYCGKPVDCIYLWWCRAHGISLKSQWVQKKNADQKLLFSRHHHITKLVYRTGHILG